jgi:hypothetical protein
MPPTIAAEWEAVRDAAGHLHAVWTLYKDLFGNKGYRRLVEKAELEGPFTLIWFALRTEILMGFGRLLDPYESGPRNNPHKNVSLDRLLRSVSRHCKTNAHDKLRKAFEEFRDYCEPLDKLWRNKRAAHMDLEHYPRLGRKKLPGIPASRLRKAVRLLRELLCKIHFHCSDRQFPFHFPTRVGDAQALMCLLDQGVEAGKQKIASWLPAGATS